MSSRSQETIYLKDYQSPAFSISSVELTFDIYDTHTVVINRMSIAKEAKSDELFLDGQDLELVSIKLDDRALASTTDQDDFQKKDGGLTLKNLPEKFQLEITTKIYPEKNKSYEGLYFSKKTLVTQMEAQGFRKVTYFIDRPDVMTTFSTTITADEKKYPSLLSNGNLVHSEKLSDGRHLARWEDPFKKPAYLFAIVAGELGMIRDEFTTCSGRKIDLRIYCETGAEDRCHHAMDALKLSMKWDEEKYGLEYDLDIFMIVAVDDFNAGAMENKGLNIFNSVYVLADPKTATDNDYQNIIGVIGHEYFHNWTGNRVTLRDWFQLSLKEGLTVFRDQEFTSDVTSRAVKRIDDVNLLRNRQFAEDAGPTAHPVRPSSVISVDNFFTVTIYEKGSELIRMMQTLLGENGFRKGMDLYFERHDEQSVTIDDFTAAMEDANSADLSQFKLWYDQSGTPRLKAKGHFDEVAKKYTLELEQTCPETPGQTNKKPFHIPVKFALIDTQGNELSLSSGGEKEQVLHLKGVKQSFSFEGIEEKPIPSLLRSFSAPVHLDANYSREDLAFLMSNDTDSFCRWEAGQTLVLKCLLSSIAESKKSETSSLASVSTPDIISKAFKSILDDTSLEPSFKARLLTLPEESYVGQFMDVIDVDGIHLARSSYKKAIARDNEDTLLQIYAEHSSDKYEITPDSIGRRSLKNVALSLLNTLDSGKGSELAYQQLQEANNMTDELSALTCLLHKEGALRGQAIQHFKSKWANESLVMNKLLRTISTSPLPGTLSEVRSYMNDPVFDADNPNKVYALIMGFGLLNPTQFHAESGEGYEFLADQVLLFDEKNPHVASYLAGSFNHWKKFGANRQKMMKTQLEKIISQNKLSGNTYEIISKNLSV